MGCYVGCATKRNKILWGIFSAMLLLGAILIAVGLSQLPVCRRKLSPPCRQNIARSRKTGQIDANCRAEFANCIRPWIIMAGVGVVGLAVALAVTFVMCCCNKTPKQAQQQQFQNTGVQMVAHPVNPYQAQAYGQQQQQQHLQPHHPYAAGSPYGGQQQQQQQPYQAQPGGYPYPQQQQQQQYGTPFGAQLPSGYPAQAQQRPYAGQAQPTSSVPVQQI